MGKTISNQLRRDFTVAFMDLTPSVAAHAVLSVCAMMCAADGIETILRPTEIKKPVVITTGFNTGWCRRPEFINQS